MSRSVSPSNRSTSSVFDQNNNIDPSTSSVTPGAPTNSKKGDYTDAAFYEPSTFGGIGNFKANKRSKLRLQYDDLVDQGTEQLPQIFKGLHLYINGFVGGDGYSDLTKQITLYGAVYVSYMDKKSLVTHIVAETLTPKKREDWAAYKLVRPAWLTDSIESGTLLDWRNYREIMSDNHPIQEGEADRMGTQLGQKSILGMLGNVSKAGLGQSSRTSAKAKGKETMEADADGEEKEVFVNNETYRPYLPIKDRPQRTIALLNDDEWMSKNTSRDPAYIENYFKQSRLHHLSAWKQELILDVAARQSIKPQRGKKLTGTDADGRTIMHVDFDSFFVACGLIARPALKGQAIAVCHAKGLADDSLASTSEIASCSYEARDAGVTAGMTFGRARELCPSLTAIPFEFELYRTISTQLYDILLSHSDLLRAISIDEAIIDVSSKFPIERGQDDSTRSKLILSFAEKIRDEVRLATNCEVSIGISHNILLARLATSKAKPANAFHLTTSNLDAFFSTLSVKSLPGVGWHIEEKMKEELKVDTVGGLKAIRRSEMQRVLGETNGIKFGNFAAGIDTTELTIDSIRKSVSAEVNYGIRFSSDTAHVSEVERFMRQLGMEVSARLKSYGNLKARSITLKVLIRHPDSDKETPKFLGHGWHTTTNATRPISGPGNTASDDGVVIGELAWGLLKELDIAPEELRGLAIKASKLETNGVSHDVVMERGQGVLQFATTTKKNVPVDPAIIPIVDTSPVDDINNEDDIIDSSPPLFESPPPNQQHASTSALALPLPKHTIRNAIASTSKLPDVIILSDSSDSDRSPQPKRRRTDAPSVAPKSPSKLHPVARIFKKVKQHSARSTSRDGSGPTASQITDEDLKELNILEVEMFRNLPREIQDDQLAHAFRTIKGLELKKKLKKEEKKPEKGKLDFTISKPTTLLVTKKPPIVPLAFKAPALSPSTIANEELLALHPNLHIDTFRELDLDTQREQIRNYARLKLLSVPGNRPIGARPNSKSGPVIQSIRMAIVPAPSFDKAVELDEIQGKITNWFDACTKVEPHVDDVQSLILFIKKCLDKKLGQDLTKMMGVMKWWKYLIETEFGEEGIDSSKNKVGRAWWKGWNEAKKAVDQVVKKEFGSIVDL